jgi:DNA-binding transcriptional regulator YiaG
MKIGSKYYPLYDWLTQCSAETVTIAIADIETMLSDGLPKTAWRSRSWWGNRSKGGHQAQAWINAGFHTTSVDLEHQTITFEKFQADYNAPAIDRVDGEILWNQTAIRALRQHMGLTQAEFAKSLGVRRQTISEWENGVYSPDRSTLKHLGLVAEKAVFDPPANPS